MGVHTADTFDLLGHRGPANTLGVRPMKSRNPSAQKAFLIS